MANHEAYERLCSAPTQPPPPLRQGPLSVRDALRMVETARGLLLSDYESRFTTGTRIEVVELYACHFDRATKLLKEAADVLRSHHG